MSDYKPKEFMKLMQYGHSIGQCAVAFYALAPDRFGDLDRELQELVNLIKARLAPIVEQERVLKSQLPGRQDAGCPEGTVPCGCGCCYPIWNPFGDEREDSQ